MAGCDSSAFNCTNHPCIANLAVIGVVPAHPTTTPVPDPPSSLSAARTDRHGFCVYSLVVRDREGAKRGTKQRVVRSVQLLSALSRCFSCGLSLSSPAHYSTGGDTYTQRLFPLLPVDFRDATFHHHHSQDQTPQPGQISAPTPPASWLPPTAPTHPHPAIRPSSPPAHQPTCPRCFTQQQQRGFHDSDTIRLCFYSLCFCFLRKLLA
jgi:hypothetical protein